MPVCKKCNNKFPLWMRISGKRKNLCSRKFCLDCSPYGEHNTRDIRKEKSDRQTRYKVKTKRFCSLCKKEKYIPTMNNVCPTCRSTKQRRDRKEKAIRLFGGKCSFCNYDKCKKALDFHHVDPATKVFDISPNWKLKWELIISELRKCVITCKNCHAEIHDGLISDNRIRLAHELTKDLVA